MTAPPTLLADRLVVRRARVRVRTSKCFTMNEMAELVERHCTKGVVFTPIPRLVLSRSDCATELTPTFYYPLFCVLAQGRKRLFLGDEEFFYDSDHYLIASLDVPVCGQVVVPPTLGVTLALEPAVLAALLLELPPDVVDASASTAVTVNHLEDDLREPLVRLLRLLDRPQEIPFMAPLIEREILFRLLLGPRGAVLRQMALPDSPLALVSQAITRIRKNFHEKMRMEELAQAVGMSSTSFHRHFRAVTAMSPLQYQKQLRLQEARRLLLSREADVGHVGFQVGYESASQFSREYRRLFGAPPSRDAAQVRRELARA